MSETKIHPTSLIEQGAELGVGVEIGPFCTIGPHVKLGDGCKVISHANIEGHTTIGRENTIFPFCSLGAQAQDLSYKNEPTRLEIGDNNTFRESVTINRGTIKDKEVTKVGNNCYLMAYFHAGHDTVIGDHCIIANSVNLAGHVHIGPRCILGGGVQISQFVDIGRGCYIGGGSAIDRDILPFCTAYGNRARLKGINIIGLRRLGHEKSVITEVVDFYRTMEASAFSPGSFIKHEECIKDFKENPIVEEIITFIEKSEVGVAPFAS